MRSGRSRTRQSIPAFLQGRWSSTSGASALASRADSVPRSGLSAEAVAPSLRIRGVGRPLQVELPPATRQGPSSVGQPGIDILSVFITPSTKPTRIHCATSGTGAPADFLEPARDVDREGRPVQGNTRVYVIGQAFERVQFVVAAESRSAEAHE